MSVIARVTSGIKAVHVIIEEQGRSMSAIIAREALEEHWDVGPDQADLLNTFLAHQDEIVAQVRRQAPSARAPVVVIKAFANARFAAAEGVR